MGLLERTIDRGYPEEYLVSRIRGRGARLISDWDAPVFSPDPPGYLKTSGHRDNIEEYSGEAAWIFLAQERKWLHTQMNGRLKDIFEPVFIYIELGTLIRCLRNKYPEKEGAETGEILRYSLLAKRIRDTILMSKGLPSLLEEMDRRELLAPVRAGCLVRIFEENGLQGLEQYLEILFLGNVLEMPLSPELREFFSYTADSRNVMALFKCLRWGVAAKPFFIAGGTVVISRLRKILHDSDMSECERLVSGLSGVRIQDPSPAGAENALQKGMAGRLKRAERKGSNRGIILNYLWECYMEAHDLSTLLYGRDLDRDLLREELIH